ncbi:hypothetical protein [Nocardioides nanhaiensis]|uniref:Condensation domain-containing protein n=1 Tax=Nocardioides nanhaiensis TaxID=1476871 RepID=A0ABP8X1A6_9ACTN
MGADATEVVGLYGDPDATWSIAVDLGLLAAVRPEDLEERAAAMVAAHLHLGPTPEVLVSDVEDERQAAVVQAYRPGDPLVRLVLAPDGRRLLVAAHHGAVDGLGLLGVARTVLDLDLRCGARGIGDRSSPTGFLLSSVRRVGEALLAPPLRFGGDGSPAEVGEHVTARELPPTRRGTAALATSVLAAHRRLHPGARGRAVLAVGASRRTDPRPRPDRQTAYLRLRLPPGTPGEQVAAALATVPPEPDFPETSAGGLGPLATRALRGRLGATATLSNLGSVEGQLRSVAMYPALNGPRAVGVGLASTALTMTLTLRTRRSDLDRAGHDRLLALIVDELLRDQ